ncbi:hypothetical protein MUO83_04035 [Candidatus Bathyarchaeota archaeon]|nr:hypothetical protein [Candidatus Bathyarchaeota archaeon]
MAKGYEGRKKQVNYNLTDETKKVYTDMAEGVGISTSEMFRRVANLAKPIGEELKNLNELAQQKKLTAKQTKRAVSNMFRAIADELDDRKR